MRHLLALVLLSATVSAARSAPTVVAPEPRGRVNLGGWEMESAWDTATPVSLEGGATVRALANDRALYLRLEWPDAEADTSYHPWRFAGAGWEQLPAEDDGVQIIWQNPAGRFDLWEWRFQQTGAVGYARDSAGPLEIFSSQEFMDEGTETWRPNSADGAPAEAWKASEAQGPPIPDPTGYVMRNPGFLFDGHTEPLGATNPFTGEAWKEGDTVPLVVNQFPTGGQADVEAVGTWHEGRWILEIRRRLDTGDAEYDIKFEAGKTYSVSISFLRATPALPATELEVAIRP
jgi:hypothetical protein